MATNSTAGNAGTHRANASSTPDVASAEEAAPEVAALQADTRRTRADLADTVDQLAAKLDVKPRVRNGVTDAKDNATLQLRRLQNQATDDDGKPTPATLGIGGWVAATMAVLVVLLWHRHNASRRPKRRRG